MEIGNFQLQNDAQFTFKDYLMVINPSYTVSKDIGNFKKHYGRLFGKASKLWSQPHITLCRFIMAEYLEKTLKNELGDFLSSRQSFPVETKGFDAWANNRVLFVRPEKERMQKLQWEMMAILRQRVRIAKAFTQKLREPHLTVAIAFNQQQFQQSWSHFSKLHYKTSFMVDGITVLSRPYSYKSISRWETLFELPLKGV